MDLEIEARDAYRPDDGRPSAKGIVAAVVVFVVLPGVAALVMVGAYLAATPR